MKQYIITVDGGTTNTRCILWDENRRRIAQENRPVGVRNTAIDGHNRKLKQAVKECLDALKVSPDTTVVVGGKNPLRQAIVDILEHEGYFARIETYVPEEGIPLSALGAYLVAEKNGIL